MIKKCNPFVKNVCVHTYSQTEVLNCCTNSPKALYHSMLWWQQTEQILGSPVYLPLRMASMSSCAPNMIILGVIITVSQGVNCTVLSCGTSKITLSYTSQFPVIWLIFVKTGNTSECVQPCIVTRTWFSTWITVFYRT